MVTIQLDDNIIERQKNNTLRAKDLIKFILEHSYLHFKVKDVKGNLEKENVYNSLSIDKLYNDDNKNVKQAYIKNDTLYLIF